MIMNLDGVLFHHLAAKLLFLCKRARPDIQTAFTFLCTRVKEPRTIIKNLDLPLSLEADNLQIMKWWINASFAVCSDMKSHMGGAFSLGSGVVYGTSTCQKI